MPAVLAGAARFLIGRLARGAIGASAVMMSNESGMSRGQFVPGGQSSDGQVAAANGSTGSGTDDDEAENVADG